MILVNRLNSEITLIRQNGGLRPELRTGGGGGGGGGGGLEKGIKGRVQTLTTRDCNGRQTNMPKNVLHGSVHVN